MTDLLFAPTVTEAEARRLLRTLRMREGKVCLALDEWRRTLLQIHDTGAYLLLGDPPYRSWSDFCFRELGMDRSKSLRVLDVAEVEEDLRAIGVAPPVIPQRQAAVLAGDPSAALEIKGAIDAGSSPVEAVRDAANRRRPDVRPRVLGRGGHGAQGDPGTGSTFPHETPSPAGQDAPEPVAASETPLLDRAGVTDGYHARVQALRGELNALQSPSPIIDPEPAGLHVVGKAPSARAALKHLISHLEDCEPDELAKVASEDAAEQVIRWCEVFHAARICQRGERERTAPKPKPLVPAATKGPCSHPNSSTSPAKSAGAYCALCGKTVPWSETERG